MVPWLYLKQDKILVCAVTSSVAVGKTSVLLAARGTKTRFRGIRSCLQRRPSPRSDTEYPGKRVLEPLSWCECNPNDDHTMQPATEFRLLSSPRLSSALLCTDPLGIHLPLGS